MTKTFESRLEAAKGASTSHLLIKCARLVNEYALATMAPLGEGGPRPRASHLALFPHIALDGGTRITHLASALGISKQAVGQLVDDLESFGVVERTPDPDDRRAKRVCFTAQGHRTMLDGLAHLASIDQELGEVVGGDAMVALHQTLVALMAHFEDPAAGVSS